MWKEKFNKLSKEFNQELANANHKVFALLQKVQGHASDSLNTIKNIRMVYKVEKGNIASIALKLRYSLRRSKINFDKLTQYLDLGNESNIMAFS
jgi:hypothetical protein